MSQTLIIHSDKALVELLNLNLPIYLGTDVISKPSFHESQILIEHHPGIHLIICASTTMKEQSAIELLKFLQIQKKVIPMIVIGPNDKVPNSPTISTIEIFELKSVLQSAAKFLKVTPKKMIEQVVPDFFPIATSFCLNLKVAPCDIYLLKENDQYEKVHQINDGIVIAEIKKLIESGNDKIFVEAANRLKFVNHVTTSLAARLKNPNMTDNEQVSAADEALHVIRDAALKEDTQVGPSTQDLTTTAIKTCMEIAKNNPTIAGMLKKLLSNKASYLYKHTQLIIQISNHILSNTEWGSTEQKGKLAFVAFFHDICLPTEKLAKFTTNLDVSTDTTLSVMDKDLVFKHAKISSEIVQKFPIAPIGSDIIIMQHHGSVSGQGFAKTYTNSISPLAIVFIIAEEFSNLILEQEEGTKISALKQVMINDLKKKYSRSKYTKVIETLNTISFE